MIEMPLRCRAERRDDGKQCNHRALPELAFCLHHWRLYKEGKRIFIAEDRVEAYYRAPKQPKKKRKC